MDSAALAHIVRAVANDAWDDARRHLDATVANLLEATPPKVRGALWRLLEPRRAAGVLQRLNEAARAEFVKTMDAGRLAALADELDTDDLAEVLRGLPDPLTEALMEAMSAADRTRVEAVLPYPEDTAGGMMNTDAVAVRPWHSIELVLRYLRRQTLPDGTNNLFVVNAAGEYLGALPVARLLTAPPASAVRDAMDTQVEAVSVSMADAQVARRFAERDWLSAPVVDAGGALVGRITVDDVVDVIIEDADEALLARVSIRQWHPPRQLSGATITSDDLQETQKQADTATVRGRARQRSRRAGRGRGRGRRHRIAHRRRRDGAGQRDLPRRRRLLRPAVGDGDLRSGGRRHHSRLAR